VIELIKFGRFIGLIGSTAIIIILMIRVVVPVRTAEGDRIACTIKSYDVFFRVGYLTLVFECLLFLICYFLFDLSHDPEWVLGLAIIWPFLAVPYFTFVLVLVIYGLLLSVSARSDWEFNYFAVHSSLTFLVALVWLFNTGSTALFYFFYLPILITYPFMCIALSRRHRIKRGS
jgi:hypothetical protein